jgi:hypothetical protein
MLEEIGDESRIPEFIACAKDKNDPFRLMGFGHRVYKNFDPRAKVMKQTCDEVLSELGLERTPVPHRAEARKDRRRGRLLRREEALPERGLLLRHHPACARHPDQHVHRDLRDRTHRRLDRTLARDDQRQLQDRSPAPALHRLTRNATTYRSTSAPDELTTAAGATAAPAAATPSDR